MPSLSCLMMTSMDEGIREQQSKVSPLGQNKPGWYLLLMKLSRAPGPVSRGGRPQVSLVHAIQAC